jgi:hypothetical protein
MPSRGSRTIKNPSKPNVEKANGITAKADTLKGADRNPGNFAAVPELDANANAFRRNGHLLVGKAPLSNQNL